mgnify:FL=1
MSPLSPGHAMQTPAHRVARQEHQLTAEHPLAHTRPSSLNPAQDMSESSFPRQALPPRIELTIVSHAESNPPLLRAEWAPVVRVELIIHQ